jgi:bacterioferritin (cytochrome b1)
MQTTQNTQTQNKDVIDQLNSLLRGEISAAETYKLAIDRAAAEFPAQVRSLRAISQEHGEAAQALRECVTRAGGDADDSSGAWGIYVKTIEGVAKIFGDTIALKALKEGEEHGLRDYRDALDSLDPESRRLVAERLIPAQERHITTLDGLIAMTG